MKRTNKPALVSNVMDFHLDDDDRLEAKIQTSIMRYLKTIPSANFAKIAQGAFSRAGVSDIVGCYRGRSVAMEVKRRATKPTPAQASYLNSQAAAGGFAAVVRSVADVKRVLEIVRMA